MTLDPDRRTAPTPARVLVVLVIAFCALLLLRWLALVALAVLLVVGAVRWARGQPVLPARRRAAGEGDGPRASLASGLRAVFGAGSAARAAARAGSAAVGDACSWCGRPGGHVDRNGERIRPRHVHVLR